MLRTGRVLALAALALAAASCGGKPEKDAAADVQTFLAAVQQRDVAEFERAIDRPAVRGVLRAQMVELSRAAGLEVEGGPSEFALNRMIGPDNLQLVDAASGQPMMSPPTVEQVRPMLKTVEKGVVCLHDGTPQQGCLLTFQKQKGGTKDEAGETRQAGWRLTGMPANHLQIAIAPPPAS
ncbi:DUF2939 domain-containing protein [Phenylobacterium deserti]|uniref:DUF2939 domain-containing protein n=1 Tax=Phenylobacterium deserti TaxID=1914756 RepID=A0A328AS80_9CAUL|nr:DUF2939 domain-containing protein [Phenylobacterium deserti]RAK57175.1 hypothetical protein DJ018_04275 [Phenylobacterium deserti]